MIIIAGPLFLIVPGRPRKSSLLGAPPPLVPGVIVPLAITSRIAFQFRLVAAVHSVFALPILGLLWLTTATLPALTVGYFGLGDRIGGRRTHHRVSRFSFLHLS